MPPTPAELRSHVLDLIRHDLLSPANGPDEIVDEPSVRGRYILGVLAPISPACRCKDELAKDRIALYLRHDRPGAAL